MKYYYNKILVPYDSSKRSDNALSEATKIAEMSGISSRHNGNIQIILLHVIQEIPTPPSLFGTGIIHLLALFAVVIWCLNIVSVIFPGSFYGIYILKFDRILFLFILRT